MPNLRDYIQNWKTAFGGGGASAPTAPAEPAAPKVQRRSPDYGKDINLPYESPEMKAKMAELVKMGYSPEMAFNIVQQQAGGQMPPSGNVNLRRK